MKLRIHVAILCAALGIVCIVADSGCVAFYVQNGYFESAAIPGWSYSFVDAVTGFEPRESRLHSYGLTISTTDKGNVYLHGRFDVPEGSTFEVDGTRAVIVSADGAKNEQELNFEVITPVATPDGNYQLPSEVGHMDKVIEGFTLERPNAVVWRRLPRYVDVTCSLKTANAGRFTVQLPTIRIDGKPLEKFEAVFTWNGRTKRIFKGIQ